jgi:predicted deacylase
VTVKGDRPGPNLTVIAGVHGTEYTSIAAAREFARSLDAATLTGTITVAPLVNPAAFWARSPFVVPMDGKNLNRSFPGKPDGSAAEVLAHHLTTTFIEPTDYLLDLHAGDLPEALEPFALYDESPVEAQAREMAIAYGLGHVVRQTRAARTVGGSTSGVAADLGKPAITAESGQNGILDRAAVDRHLAGLAGVCAGLGLLPGAPTNSIQPREHEGWHWLRTPVAGWWEPTVSVGQPIAAGELIGVVGDVLGEGRHEVRSPEAGVPLFVTTSPAVVADGLLMGIARGL